MKFRLVANDVIYGSISAIAVFAVLYFLVPTYVGFSLAIVFAILTFMISLSLLGDSLVINISVRRINSSKKFQIFIFMLFMFSFLSVIFVPSLNNLIFMKWSSIPLPNWIRFITGISLAILWPGYFILKLLDRDNTRIKHSLDRLVLSYVVSIFVSIILGVINISWNHRFSTSFAEKQLLGLNTILFTTFLAFNFKNITNKRDNRVKADFKMDYPQVILLLLSAFFILSYFFVYSSFGNINMLHGDLMNHHGLTLDILTGRVIDRISTYYPYFHLYLANLMILAGLPSANAFTLFGLLNVFYILAFYIMTRVLIGEKSKIPALSTVIFIIFNGFEWIFVEYLKLYGEFPSLRNLIRFVSIETRHGITYSSFSQLYYHAPHTVAFVSLFTSLYIIIMIINEKKTNYKYQLLLFITTSVTIFSHLLEAYIFAVIFIVLILIVKKAELKSSNLSLFTYTSCFLIAITTDFLLLAKAVIRIQLVYGLLLGLTLSILSVLSSNTHFSFRPRMQGLVHRLNKLKTPTIFLLLYLIGLSFIIWNTSPLPITYLEKEGYRTTPWYYYPLKLGAVGFLALGSLLVIDISQKRKMKFLILSAVVMFGLMKLVSLINISYFFFIEENRLFPHFFIPLSIMSAYCLSTIYKRIIHLPYKYNKLFAAGFLALVFIAGTCTTIMQIQYWSDEGKNSPYPNVSLEDFEVLNFVKDHVDGVILVLPTSPSASIISYKMSNLAGRVYGPRWALLDGTLETRLSDLINPESALYALRGFLNVSYIAVLSDDMPKLNTLLPENSILLRLITYSQVIFSNSELTIFKLPSLRPPSSNANFTLVYPNYFSFYSKINSMPPLNVLQMAPDDGDEWTEADILAWSALSETIDVSDESAVGALSIYISVESTGELNINRYIPSVNASNYDLLRFYINTKSKLPSILMRVGKDPGNVFYTWLDLHAPSSSFQEITLKLGPNSIGWTTYGNPNWNDIRYICFNVRSSVKNSQILIDGLAFIETPKIDESTWEQDRNIFYTLGMLAQSNISYEISNHLDWNKRTNNSEYTPLIMPYDPKIYDSLYLSLFNYTAQGGNLVVINGLGSGGFAELLGLTAQNYVEKADKILFNGGEVLIPPIQVPRLISTDSYTKPIAYYANHNGNVTVFLYQKDIGEGHVLYVNLMPYVQALENIPSNNVAKATLFSKLKSLFDVIKHTFYANNAEDQSNTYLHDVIIKGNVLLSGTVDVHSTSPTLLWAEPIYAKEIKFTSNYSNTLNTLSDVYVFSMNISEGAISDMLINSDSVKLISPTSGSYSVLQVDGGDLTFRLNNDAGVKLNLRTLNGERKTLAIESGQIGLSNISSALLILKSPDIMVTGKVSFVKAWISEDIIRDRMARDFPSIVFEGNIGFNVLYSDDDLLFLSNFNYQGDYTYPSAGLYPTHPSLLYLEITSIPWKLVLTSPWHIVLILCIMNLITLFKPLNYRREPRED